MIWQEIEGKWCVVKKFKGVSWEAVDFSYEHKTQCPVCFCRHLKVG